MFVEQSMVLLQSPVGFIEIFLLFYTVYAKPRISYEVLAYGWCAKSNLPFLKKKLGKKSFFYNTKTVLFPIF